MSIICIYISEVSPLSADAISLMDELSDCLEQITGDSGRSSFKVDDFLNEKAIFIIARDQAGTVIGCGAYRPVDAITAEVKRMYSRHSGAGVGGQVLAYLEERAYEMGYRVMQLETRIINTKAVQFYERNGYKRISNYGKYRNREDAACFEKELSF